VRTAPFVYPPGWGDRRWEVGAFLPPFFLVRDYWYPDWGLIGLPPPPPDYQWVRYGSDLLLVDLTSGEVIATSSTTCSTEQLTFLRAGSSPALGCLGWAKPRRID
jgi:hypothetical protein